MTVDAAAIARAYAVCEQITGTQARNFAWGIRLLPGSRRRALSSVYALARRIDDIGDSNAPAAGREADLRAVRDQVAALAAAGADRRGWPVHDPVLLAVADAAVTSGLPLAEFGVLVDGCLADVRGTRYATFAQLNGYCRQVAGSIGRLSVAVFRAGPAGPAGPADPVSPVCPPGAIGPTDQTGPTDESGRVGPLDPLADALGTALQLTNILRDVREDARAGRVYLPAEDLARFGCTMRLDEHGELADDTLSLVGLVEYEAARAAEWFDVGLRLLPLLDRRSRACCAAMAGVYRELLTRIVRRPEAVLAGRVSVPGPRKAAVMARSLTGARRPALAPVDWR